MFVQSGNKSKQKMMPCDVRFFLNVSFMLNLIRLLLIVHLASARSFAKERTTSIWETPENLCFSAFSALVEKAKKKIEINNKKKTQKNGIGHRTWKTMCLSVKFVLLKFPVSDAGTRLDVEHASDSSAALKFTIAWTARVDRNPLRGQTAINYV